MTEEQNEPEIIGQDYYARKAFAEAAELLAIEGCPARFKLLNINLLRDANGTNRTQLTIEFSDYHANVTESAMLHMMMYHLGDALKRNREYAKQNIITLAEHLYRERQKKGTNAC